MGFVKDLIMGPQPPPKQMGPVKVIRYWRELDETKVLGLCRTAEEANRLIHADQDAFGTYEAREILSYHLEPIQGQTEL
jgi:hypothetical protein